MSTEAILSAFPVLSYAEGITGATVRGGHTIARVAAANIVALAQPARRIGPMQGSGASATQHVGYVRSHDSIGALWLAWYYRPDPSPFAALATISLTTTIRDDIGNTITSSDPVIPLGFDGTVYTANRVVLADDPVLGAVGYVDLDAAAAILTGTSWDFEFAWARSGGNVALDRIEGWECPRSQVDSADTYGALTGPENPGNAIVAGDVASIGYERIAKTIEAAPLCGRTLLSVAWPTDTGIAPVTTSGSFTALTRMLEGGATPWSWYVRPRMLYAPSSATGEPHRVRYLYQVTGGGSAAVRCTVVSVGAASTTIGDVSGLASATWAWSDWADVSVPTDGTDRIVAVQITAKTTAGSVYIAAIQLEEYQT